MSAPYYDAFETGSNDNSGAAYMVSRGDFERLDLADGRRDRVIHLSNIAHGESSWRLIGEPMSYLRTLTSSGDMDGDGVSDVLVGASLENDAGAAYFVSGSDLLAADEADGERDRTVRLALAVGLGGSFRLDGEGSNHYAGVEVAVLADRDGDGRLEILVGAQGMPAEDYGSWMAGAVYLVASGDLEAADAADGDADGRIALGNVAAQPGSYRFVREVDGDRAGSALASVGDADGDGVADILIGAGELRAEQSGDQRGAAYLVSGARLGELDAADGSADGTVELAIAAGNGAYRFATPSDAASDLRLWALGRFVEAAGDMDGDGLADFMLGAGSSASVLISGSRLGLMDADDGLEDGRIDASRVGRFRSSMALVNVGSIGSLRFGAAADVALELRGQFHTPGGACHVGGAYLHAMSALTEAELNSEFMVDREAVESVGETYVMRGGAPQDHLGRSGNVWADIDGDGASDILLAAGRGWRDDGREEWRPPSVYLLMAADLAALDAADGSEDQVLHFGNFAGDTDGDGLLNTLDEDDDGDGVEDGLDAFPLDATEWVDTDGDCLGNNADLDDDGDGVMDVQDALPLDPLESLDTDGDGIGDNADTDDDGDGVSDAEDLFPLDSSESTDSDGDGVGDNADAFPSDASEAADTDGDGIGDNADPDDDNDGTPDATDLAPLDATRTDMVSYEFVGQRLWDFLIPGTWEGGDNGQPHVLLGARYFDVPGTNENTGAAYMISRADFERLDSADGLRDRVVHLSNIEEGESSWRLIGEPGSRVGQVMTSTGDMDGDGVVDLLLGATGLNNYAGGAYFVSGADLPAADAADGERDRTVRLELVVGSGRSFRLEGEGSNHYAGGEVAALEDRDGDGRPEILVGAQGLSGDSYRSWMAVAVYLVESGDLKAADAADGAEDGRVALDNTASQPGSYRFARELAGDRAGKLASVGDADGDGVADILIGAQELLAEQSGDKQGVAYLVSGARLGELDASDGSTDGTVDLALSAGNGAYRFATPRTFGYRWRFWGLGAFVEAAGDIDGDGSADFLLESNSGSFLISGASLSEMDAADSLEDGRIDTSWVGRFPASMALVDVGVGGRLRVGIAADVALELRGTQHIPGGACKAGGAYLNAMSALTGAEVDSDLAVVSREAVERAGESYVLRGGASYDWLGASGNAWTDFDGDGSSDILLDASRMARFDGLKEWRSPSVYLLAAVDLALLDAADGLADRQLHFGNFAGDTDRDGLSNTLDTDDDGDGVPDVEDAFPLDATEWGDPDGDCVGNNIDFDDDDDGFVDEDDAFPLDPTEWVDTDGDGVGDNADTDDDGDGVEDRLDLFPLDPARSALRSFRFDAETEDSRLGSSLAVIGDIDGDGTPEVALGAPNAETGGAAYVLSTPELGMTDNADGAEDGAVSASGIAARAGSWELRGGEGQSAVVSVFAVGDLTGDGSPEFGVVTGPDGEQSVYVVSGTDLAEADAEDGTSDGVLDLSALSGNGRASRRVSGLRRAAGDGLAAIGDADDDGRADLLVSESMADDEAGLAGLILGDVGARAIYDWTFSGEQAGDTAGRGLSAADFDGDGLSDLVVGAPGREDAGSGGGAVYVAGSRDWRAIDAEDGTQDRRIAFGRVASAAHSWKLRSDNPHTQLGARVLVGDVDGDGRPDLVLPAAFSDGSQGLRVFVASGDSDRLAALDTEDGAGDGELRLRVGDSLPGRWTFDLDAGEGARIGLDDFDGDGRADLLVGLPPADQANGVCAYLFAAADVFSGAMSGTGSAEPLNGVWPHPNSYAVQDCPAWGDAAPVLQAPGDLDGDEAPDLLIGIPESAEGGAVYLISGADLQALDRLDGHRDRTISLARINRDPPR